MTDWPAPVDDAALHGPAGEFVLLTEPHTESDPMALLAQFLVCFGTAIGRTAHYAVEASRHFGNEFVVLVGPSSKGRKGSSWDHVARVMAKVDPHFIGGCVSSGMSSGEGLIAEVADDKERQPDKRRLVVEPEFAQVMKVLSREGNTLSPVVRNAWDGKALQTMVRNSPLRATDTHIGIIGHITKEELLRHINGTELANGFFNRFMLVAVQRSTCTFPGPRRASAPAPSRRPANGSCRFRFQVRATTCWPPRDCFCRVTSPGTARTTTCPARDREEVRRRRARSSDKASCSSTSRSRAVPILTPP